MIVPTALFVLVLVLFAFDRVDEQTSEMCFRVEWMNFLYRMMHYKQQQGHKGFL